MRVQPDRQTCVNFIEFLELPKTQMWNGIRTLIQLIQDLYKLLNYTNIFPKSKNFPNYTSSDNILGVSDMEVEFWTRRSQLWGERVALEKYDMMEHIDGQKWHP